MTGGGRLTLPTFVIGPQSQGRNYRVLAQSSPIAFTRATDLAMVLMEWSRTDEKSFAACVALPEGEGAVVFRAWYRGRGALGEEAFLNGVMIDSASLAALGHRTELVLGEIKEPDGTGNFGRDPVEVAVPEQEQLDWPDLGLAWADRLILVERDEDRDAILIEALRSIWPVEERPRVAGWATSAQLVPRGGLDLLRDSQLVVATEPVAAPPPGLLPYSMKSDGEKPAAPPPPAWLAWEAAKQHIGGKNNFAPAVSALKWRQGYGALPAERVVADALRMASSALPPLTMLELLGTFRDAGVPALAGAVRSVQPEYVAALHEQGMDAPLSAVLKAMGSGSPDFAALALACYGKQMDGNVHAGDLSELVGYALEATRSGKTATDPDLRGNIISLIRKSIDTLEPRNESFDKLKATIKSWPPAFRRDLLVLTSKDLLKIISTKSRGVLEALSTTVLQREYYSEGCGHRHWPVVESLFFAMMLLKAR